MWEAEGAEGLLAAHCLQNEGRCLWPVCSLQGGDNGSQRISAELAGKWHEQLSSHGGLEQGNENAFEN